MKKSVYILVLVSIVVLGVSNNQAQIIIGKSTENKLISYGIDPENFNQVIDSLETEDDYKRLWLIDWVGQRKIYQAIPNLQLLFYQPNTERFPKYRSMEQRATILKAVIYLEDTTFVEEFKQELDSLALSDENHYVIIRFSTYLQEKQNDSYGWQYMKKFYAPEYPEITTVPFFYIEVYSLKPFLNSIYIEEVVEILRNFAAHNYIALEYLAEINDPETEQLAINMSLNHAKDFSRYRANKVLKDINLDSYITTLKASLNTVTGYRGDIYDGLLSTTQPAVYKYVVDIYNSNQYPADSSIILQELDNQYFLYPEEANSVIDLLDSLSSALFQFNSFGWFGDINFVNEMNSYVLNSKSYYLANDTISSANQLKVFREEIDQELRDTTDIINEYVRLETWNYLYPRTYFIENRINSELHNDTLISITPSSVIAGSSTISARIIGSGFNNYTYLFWNDNDFLEFEIISPTEINLTIPGNFLEELGENKIYASDALSDYTNSLSFTVSEESAEGISTYSIFATHSVWIRQNSEIHSGSVGVNEAGEGPFLDSKLELSVGKRSITPSGYTVKGNRIKVKQNAVVNADVYHNELTNNGTITGSINTPLEFPLIADLPEFHSSTPGTEDIVVSKNGEYILSPGSYKNIEIKKNGKLIFTGGEYNINKIDGRNNDQLLFQSPSEVKIKKKFYVGQGSYIGPEDTTTLSADEIVFYIEGKNGRNGRLNAEPKASKIGAGSKVKANFYVPNGTMWIRKDCEAEGSFIGKDVKVGASTIVKLNSAW
ncbi:hypothetical protein ACFLSH_00410 [Bacteroidota bacterium]